MLFDITRGAGEKADGEQMPQALKAPFNKLCIKATWLFATNEQKNLNKNLTNNRKQYNILMN